MAISMPSGERAQAENGELLRLDRALRMTSRCRSVLQHAGSAEEMMEAVCRCICEEGGYALAWTAAASDRSGTALAYSEIHGTAAGRFAAACSGWARGCTCSAIGLDALRDGKPWVTQGSAAAFGYPGAIALPLGRAGDEAMPAAVLCVHSADPAAFSQDEVALLQELAADLALAMNSAREADRRRAAEQLVGYRPGHDPATGLANRALFNDRLHQALLAAGRSGGKVAVLALTLDRYRGVKASLGHDACEAMLAHAAAAMKSCLRGCDTVARLLGNEFAVVVPGLGSDEDVLPVAAKLLEAVKIPMRWRDNIIGTTASIGISLMGEDAGDASGMLRAANSAMAQALGHGGNRLRFVAPAMNERASRMFALEADLRRALVHKELELHYQPRASLGDGALAGAAALVHWRHPTRGLVPPAEFMPLAANSGLIVPLGAWMIREVCRQQRERREASLPWVPVSLKLWPRQFREEGLVEHIAVALQENDVPPAMLCFEIGEATMADTFDDAVARLRELKGSGARLSLDDFGSGPGSLARLRLLPVDQLKISQCFVRQLGSEQADEAICRAIIDLGHSLNMRIVADGVETLLQREWLRAHHCDEIQGGFYARPVAAEDFAQLLAADRPRSNTMLPLWKAINYKG